MHINQDRSNNPLQEREKLSGSIGNASNPIPQGDGTDGGNSNQLLDEKAEKYIREVASIEDVPDAQDQQDMDDTINKEQ